LKKDVRKYRGKKHTGSVLEATKKKLSKNENAKIKHIK